MDLTPNVSLEPPALETHDDGEEASKHVHVGIYEVDGTGFQADMHLPGDAAPSYLAAALLSCARGAAATHSTMLAALFRDLIETQQALANAIPGHTELRAGIRVADVDLVIAHHRAADHHPRLAIPGLEHPVDADVVRAILMAAGAY